MPQPTAQAQPQPAAQAQAQAPVDEEMVGTLQAISGKGREECIRALQAAFGDPDRAFEYATMGIPAGMGAMPQGHPGAGFPAGHDQAMEGDYGDEDDGSVDPGAMGDLAAFAQNPQFQQLRQRMIQNPQFYQEFMQML